MEESLRTKFNIENIVRIAFHPKGFGQFIDGMNSKLELGPKQSKVNHYLGFIGDIEKYILYASSVAALAYELLK